MAVQAQYPSNLLLLHRNLQEGNNQSQPGGGGSGSGGGTTTAQRFLDYSLDNNPPPPPPGSGNPRKRVREAVTGSSIKLDRFMSSLQPAQSHLVHLTNLHSQPQNVDVSTGLRLAFSDRPQPQSSLVLSEDFFSQIKHQRHEIEHFIQSQGEELRRTLAEKRKRHYCALIGAAEESVARRLREKESEVERVSRRNAELEARAAQLIAEAQAWQARARAQEATAVALQGQLQQAIINGGDCGGGAHVSEREEVDGCEAEDAESGYIDPERVVASNGSGCRACGKRVASVVVLPCRHLCVCTECDAAVQSCPLCLSFKTSSIEVFLY